MPIDSEGLRKDLTSASTMRPFETDLDRVLNSAHTADIVFIPDERLLTKYFPYPVNGLLANHIQRLRKDATMLESTPVELPDGAMLIFRRR